MSIVGLCLLFTGCSIFGGGKPGHRGWAKIPIATKASEQKRAKKNEQNDKSAFASWFGSKEPEPPKTVREWMEQTTPVHP